MDMPANCRLLFPRMLDRALDGGWRDTASESKEDDATHSKADREIDRADLAASYIRLHSPKNIQKSNYYNNSVDEYFFLSHSESEF